MTKKISIRKGLTINLKGKAEERIAGNVSSEFYSIVPDDFLGIVPKVVVKPGDKLLAGQALLIDKNRPDLKVGSPVSGEVIAVNRGERRKVLDIQLKADDSIEYAKWEVAEYQSFDANALKQVIMDAGLWWVIKQRPFDVIADPSVAPRDIFVTAFDSSPLAPNADFALNGELAQVQVGVDVLKKLTAGKVYFSIQTGGSPFTAIKGAEVIVIDGPHPAGNVGVQINNIAPVNKGETVWTLDVNELAMIGRLFTKGVTDMSRVICLAGSEVAKAHYMRVLPGVSIEAIVNGNVVKTDKNLRYISGSVLSGKKVALKGALGMYSRQVVVIPEGDDYNEFVGWAMPGFDKFSVSKTYFSWIPKMLRMNKEYVIDARIRGGKRGIIMSNEYDKVFPMDILPEQLIKATMAFNIEKMENLGIYEVAPEDFALCEFVDTSKLEIQKIIRDGLDKLFKELM